MNTLAGLDIGGTKCAVSLGVLKQENRIEILDKMIWPTPSSPDQALQEFVDHLGSLLAHHPHAVLQAIGISCGGPLDAARGIILSPPNLPGWDFVDVVSVFRDRFGVAVGLQNDANACALAEWMWGAGIGTKHMVYLTFGTGMGAGIIANGQLYGGANDMAGEVGHIRLQADGPVGYGKAGSFEGFCSGGGIARLGASMAQRWLTEGKSSILAPQNHVAKALDARQISLAAVAGDELATTIMDQVARQLGMGLSMIIDILNPEMIVIGGIFARQRTLFESIVQDVVRAEALPISSNVCKIVPSALGELVGDYSSLSVAHHVMRPANHSRDTFG